MHRTKLALAGLLLLGTAAAPAPTALKLSADELVAKNLAARGGADKVAALKSVRFDGRLVFPGDFQLTYRETRARDAAGDVSRVDASLQGLTVVSAYDGKSGWRINPFQGRKDAETMSADEARSIANSSLIEGPLQAAKRTGSTVTALGREDFDGTLAWKLKVTEKDGDEFVYLLDPDTFLEIKITETRRLRGSPQVTETELGDYEQVAGVYFPMSIESWQQGQSNQRQRVLIASATANPAVTPALFAQPATPVPAGRGTSSTSGQADADQAAPPKPSAPPPPDPAKPGAATSPKGL